MRKLCCHRKNHNREGEMRKPQLDKQVSKPNGAGVSRREFLARASVLGAGLALTPWSSVSAAPHRTSISNRETKMQHVRLRNGPIMLAANLYLPPQHDTGQKYAAIVVVHPGGGVKEQTAGLYAANLAAQGFVTVAFDASHQGESGGEPRLLESPQARVGDVRAAVDYLTTLAYVDPARIGALGICAGSGYTIKASTLERRIRAVATVSAVDTGASARKGGRVMDRWRPRSRRSRL